MHHTKARTGQVMEKVVVEKPGGIAHVRINRTEVLNARDVVNAYLYKDARNIVRQLTSKRRKLL